MKYIRTKDGIYELCDTYYMSCGGKTTYMYIDHKDRHTGIEIDSKLIINQADTIEELCDEFVIDDKRNNVHYLMEYYDVIDEVNNGRIYKEDIIYGAIWCDKGLIYVAKMNEKGCLELI